MEIISRDDFAQIIEDSQLGFDRSSPEFDTFYDYIAPAVTEAAAVFEQAQYDALLGVLQQNPPQAVLDKIRERAASNARDLATNMARTELTTLHEQIAEQTALGKGPRAVARKLDAVKGLDNNRIKQHDKYVQALREAGVPESDIAKRADDYYQKLLADRKRVIAQTEMRQGTSQVNEINALARGAKFKVWQTVGDDRVSDECQANEAQGPIPIGDKFTSGAKTAPQHPQCRCTVSYYSNPALTDIYQRRADERAANTAASKSNNV